MSACSIASRLDQNVQMIYLNTPKNFPFLGPSMPVYFQRQWVLFSCCFCPCWVLLPVCDHRLEAKIWKTLLSPALLFSHFFTLCAFFFFFSFPGTNLHDGLWHSVNINARRHRITLTLDNNAATASHATIVSRIYSGNSYYFGGKLFQIDIGQVFMMEILRFWGLPNVLCT